MSTMKEVCEQINMPYETLKFYCKKGLVPNVKRDKNNYRDFNEANIAWLKGLQCLRKCGLSIQEMKQYMSFCMEGPSTIPQRKEMLETTRAHLLDQIEEIKESIDYIDQKQEYYDQVLDGILPYSSNLTK